MPKPLGSVPQIPALASTPAVNPPAGALLLYFKSDGKLYQKSSAGVEALVDTGGAAVVPVQNAAPSPDGGEGSLWWDADDVSGYTASLITSLSLRTPTNLTGGGTVSVSASYELGWTTRFIAIANGRGSYGPTAGYYDIAMPAASTVITGVGGAPNATVTAAGVPLGIWTALYYILPLGASSASVPANFRVVTYTADVDIPEHWILIAVRNNDNSQVRISNGISLTGGGLWSMGNTAGSLTGTVPTARLGSGTASSTTYLRGDNTWAAPPSPIEPDRFTRSSKDANSVFTVIEWFRADATRYKRSVLSGGVSPKYTTRTITYYQADGTTVASTETRTISYDVDDEVTSEA